MSDVPLNISDEQQNALTQLLKLNNQLIKNKYFKLFNRKKLTYGIYLHGKVGRGKTMLMDMFYKQVPIKVTKLRTHYQDFMLEVHQRIFKLEQAKYSRDVILRIAKDLAKKYRLICLDELQISDIADAMIVGRLFEHLIKFGTIMVITSNAVVDELYKDGLQREYFLKFIELIKQKLKILELSAASDYRLMKAVNSKQRYFYPLDINTKNQIDALIAEIVGKPLASIELEVNGRKLHLAQAYKHILVSNFKELCQQNLGAGDYGEICKKFKIIFLLDIPQLSVDERNEAKRFMMLIDHIYDHKLMLFCSANVSASSLYLQGDGVFEFQRTISRLIEIQSSDYI
jgi:cell division protein ZapE